MITDPVGDLLTRIRNAVSIKTAELSVPHSRLKKEVIRVLKEEGYVESFKKEGRNLQIVLTFKRRQPRITGIKNVSKPGLRIYRKKNELPRPLGGVGISIVSTPKGVMSNRKAWKEKLGGEVLALVW
ncbi:MAG: 30S ribosomal protein S8 [Patescibacteria group bacterium]